MAETGFVGFSVFMSLIVDAIYNASKTVSRFKSHFTLLRHKEKFMYALSQGLLIGIVSFSIAGTFLSQAFTWPLYILLGLLVANRKYLESRLVNSSDDMHTFGDGQQIVSQKDSIF